MRQKLTTIQYLDAADRYSKMEAPLCVIAADIGVSDATLHRKFLGDNKWSREHGSLLPDIDRLKNIAKFWQWTAKAKIRPQQVKQIRLLHRQGVSCRILAGELGVSERTINNIVRDRVWQWVK